MRLISEPENTFMYEFTLKYDEDSKSTSIERGYLIGAKL